MATDQPCRILLVEDEPVIVALVEELLQEAGFEVASATDGAQALGIQLDAPCHLAIVDYGLPDMNGLEVAQRLGPAPDGRRPKVVLATGWGMLDPRQLAGTVEQLLEKPYNMRELVALVERLKEGN